VFVSTVDYGGINGVEYLDSGRHFGLFNDTIAALKAVGYEAGKCDPSATTHATTLTTFM